MNCPEQRCVQWVGCDGRAQQALHGQPRRGKALSSRVGGREGCQTALCWGGSKKRSNSRQGNGVEGWSAPFANGWVFVMKLRRRLMGGSKKRSSSRQGKGVEGWGG